MNGGERVEQEEEADGGDDDGERRCGGEIGRMMNFSISHADDERR